MANGKYGSDEDAVREELSEFNVVKKTKRAGSFLPPDSGTPDVGKLHRHYNSDSPEESVLEKAPPPSDESATHAVVVEPKTGSDRVAKQLTVLVKKGKVRATQG